MESIRGWGPGESAAWLRGLHSTIQKYCFEEWNLTGEDLLRISSLELENYGVKSIGHQELILEAVEQLCALNYDLKTDSLRSLTERLKNVCVTLWTFIQSHRRISTYDGTAIQRPPSDLLACVIQLVSAARSLFSWLNRYLFTRLNDYSASKEVIALCAELSDIVHKENLTVSEKEDRILPICQNISAVCENILSSSPEYLLNQRASVEAVHLVPVPPEDSLGIEITSTSFGLHFVSGTLAESPAGHSAKVLPGDEIIQVNGQVVVGWSRMNLVKKLLERSSGVSLVLKKVTLSSSDQPSSPASPQKQVFTDSCANPAAASNFQNDESPKISIIASPSVVAVEFPEKMDSGNASALDKGHHVTPHRTGSQPVGSGSPSLKSRNVVDGAQDQVISSVTHETPKLVKESQSSFPKAKSKPGPQPTESREATVVNRRKQKGVATRLSRRRVSCKDLGQADCDGWLWKKKENPGFMSQRWKRCWCHLTGNSLYWYNHPHDEKAVGFINVSTYYLESAREPKKKYEFQLCHEKYKPFVFAADSLAEMSMWVTRLITSVTKYTSPSKAHHPKEEDCYSESEADDAEEESPRPLSMPDEPKREMLQPLTQVQHLLPTAANSGSKEKVPPKSPLAVKRPESYAAASADPPVDDIEVLFQCLKQGGVSLIGKERLLTREQLRQSFIKRNKDPQINDRAHAVRTLKSTLKAKESELQVLEQVLNNPALTSETFKNWKKDHEEMYRELQSLWVQKPVGKQESSNPSKAPEKEKPPVMESKKGVPERSDLQVDYLTRGTEAVGSAEAPKSPLGVKNIGEMWTPQGMWSPLDMGSPLAVEKLMGSLEDIRGLNERRSMFDTWSLQEIGTPQETRFHETGSLPDRKSTKKKENTREKDRQGTVIHQKEDTRDQGSYLEKECTAEDSCTLEKVGSREQGDMQESGSCQGKGSTQEKEGTRKKGSHREREGPQGKRGSSHKGCTREKGSPWGRNTNDSEASREKRSPARKSGSCRDAGSPKDARRRRDREEPREPLCAIESGYPRESGSLRDNRGSERRARRSSEGSRSLQETSSTQRKKSTGSGQDGEKRERHDYLCI
ncbi:connector enhancer of kinase suppressor of ras 1 [Lissotriton helveticus]